MNGTARACCEWEIRDGVPCGRTDLAVDGEARICFIHVGRWINTREMARKGLAAFDVSRSPRRYEDQNDAPNQGVTA